MRTNPHIYKANGIWHAMLATSNQSTIWWADTFTDLCAFLRAA